MGALHSCGIIRILLKIKNLKLSTRGVLKNKMNHLPINKHSFFLMLVAFQQLLLFSYLALNIENVGEMGVGLPLLAGFVIISCGIFVTQLLTLTLRVRLNLFLFLMLIFWVSLRVVLDFGDIEHLKQITVATTGGMLLFFLIGTFSRQALDYLTKSNKSNLYPKLLILVFCLLCLIIFLSFKVRLLDREDKFYIAGVNGGYQRPGNFMIMLFIMASFSYLSIVASFKTKGVFKLIVWIGMYTLGLALLLISSQMIGSNAATANLLAIYLMTIVISLLASSTQIRLKFIQGRFSLPLSKTALRKLINYSGVALITLLFLAIVAIEVTGFDLNKTRVFGFGSGTNNSMISRVDIFLKTGPTQLNYAPFFGNANVAELTTGNAGRKLHNFLPNIMAELGLVGLIITLSLFFFTFRTLKNTIKFSFKNAEGFKVSIINFWLFFVLIFLFIYVNIAVGKNWPVMWFFIGFAVNVFVSRKKYNLNMDV
jgi:hypothetical protein